MHKLVFVFYFFLSSIFFSTFSLFNVEYSSGNSNLYAQINMILSVLICLIIGVNLIKSAFKRKLEFSKVKINIIMIYLFLLLCVIYAYFNFNQSSPVQQLLLLFIGVTTPSVFFALNVDKEYVTKFFSFSKYINLYITLCILVAYLRSHYSGLAFDSIGGGNHFAIGYTMSTLFAFNLIQASSSNKKISKLFYFALMTFNILMTILSGSRGALVCIIAIFIFYAITSARKLLFVTPIVVVSVYTLFQVLPITQDRNLYRMQALLSGNYELASGGRDFFYDAAIQRFYDSPIIGHGIGSFADSMGYFIYPHNIFLEILHDFGILGFTIFTIILAICVKEIFSMIKQKQHYQFIALLFVNSFMNLMFSSSYLIHSQFWICIILVITNKYMNRERTAKKHFSINRQLDETAT